MTAPREDIILILQQNEPLLSDGYHHYTRNPKVTLGALADQILEVLQTKETPVIKNLRDKLDAYLKDEGNRHKTLGELEAAIEKTTASIHQDKTIRVSDHLLHRLKSLKLEAVQELIETQKAAAFIAPEPKPEKPLATLQNAWPKKG